MLREKCFNVCSGCGHIALLEIGFSAAAAVEGGGHFLAQLPKIAALGGKTVGKTSCIFGKYGGKTGRYAADAVCQFPHLGGL